MPGSRALSAVGKAAPGSGSGRVLKSVSRGNGYPGAINGPPSNGGPSNWRRSPSNRRSSFDGPRSSCRIADAGALSAAVYSAQRWSTPSHLLAPCQTLPLVVPSCESNALITPAPGGNGGCTVPKKKNTPRSCYASPSSAPTQGHPEQMDVVCTRDGAKAFEGSHGSSSPQSRRRSAVGKRHILHRPLGCRQRDGVLRFLLERQAYWGQAIWGGGGDDQLCADPIGRAVL